MVVMKTKLNKRPFVLGVTEDAQESVKGLSNTKKLKNGAGMLFTTSPGSVFNTTNMNYPIDMLFLDKDFNVLNRLTAEPGLDNIDVGEAMYVLETNPGEISEKKISIEQDNSEEKDSKPNEENIIVTRVSESQAFKNGGRIYKPVESDIPVKEGMMQVLDDGGKVLMNIVGGERIFSRKHPKLSSK